MRELSFICFFLLFATYNDELRIVDLNIDSFHFGAVNINYKEKISKITISPTLCFLLMNGNTVCPRNEGAEFFFNEISRSKKIDDIVEGPCVIVSGERHCYAFRDERRQDSQYDIDKRNYRDIGYSRHVGCGLNVNSSIECWDRSIDYPLRILSTSFIDRFQGREINSFFLLSVLSEEDGYTDRIKDLICVFMEERQKLICLNVSDPWYIYEENEFDALQVTTTDNGMCFIKSLDRKVECFSSGLGRPHIGYLDDGSLRYKEILLLPSFAEISGGTDFVCGIRLDGEGIHCWGLDDFFLPGQFDQIDCHYDRCCALTSDRNTVTCWGSLENMWLKHL